MGWSEGACCSIELPQRLWVAWPPIVDLTQGTVIEHEALIRGPTASRWPQPPQRFGWAKDVEPSDVLEMTCRQLAYCGQSVADVAESVGAPAC